MARVVYIGPYGALSVAGIEARFGEPVELPAELVHGTPPVHVVDPVTGARVLVHPGTSGLLALTDVWAPAPDDDPGDPVADDTPSARRTRRGGTETKE